MTDRQATKVSRNIRRSPLEIERAIRAFSANARSFIMSREEALEKYKDKWIAIHKGEVVAVADSQDVLIADVESKSLPANEILYQHIDSKDKVFIL
jgi:hypothetical protein